MARVGGPPSDFAIRAQVNQRDVDRALKNLDKWQGAELAKRTEKVLRAAATLLKDPIRRESPRRSGRMRRSVGIKKLRKQADEMTAYYVGPRTFYSQWVQDGTRRGVDANPFVERATAPRMEQINSFIEEQIRRLA